MKPTDKGITIKMRHKTKKGINAKYKEQVNEGSKCQNSFRIETETKAKERVT